MGCWGSGLYQNDAACDVKDAYIGFLEEGLSNSEAYTKTLEKCQGYIGYPDEPLLWLALAETQWRLGRLTPEVKEKAMEWIEKGAGIELWEESKSGGAAWKKTIEKLKIKLDSPIPKEKKIRKPEEIDMNLWNVNDVYAYQFHGKEAQEHGFGGKYMLIQKIGEGKGFTKGLKMRVHVLDKIFDELPTIDDINGTRILPFDYPTMSRILCMSVFMAIYVKREYPAKYLTFIGNRPGLINIAQGHHRFSSIMAWRHIEVWHTFFEIWRGVEYEAIGDGSFRYVHE